MKQRTAAMDSDAQLRLAVKNGLKARAGLDRDHEDDDRRQPLSPLLAAVQPLVLDANRIRNDALYACRTDHDTTLISTAKHGWCRLCCAPHVIDEIGRHCDRWEAEGGFAHGTLRSRLERSYLPLIRVVDVDCDSVALSVEERKRIDDLAHGPERLCDPDDVPTAMLAVLLRAPVLTDDKKVLWAVYGPDIDLATHDTWLAVLDSIGVASQITEILNFLASLVSSLGPEAVRMTRWLWQKAPLVLIGGGALLGRHVRQSDPEVRSGVKHKVRAGIGLAGDLLTILAEGSQALEGFTPPRPEWNDVLVANDASGLLTRACLQAIARSPDAEASAAHVAALLPGLPVGQSVNPVRSALRSCESLHEVAPGCWSLGTSAVGPATALWSKADGL